MALIVVLIAENFGTRVGAGYMIRQSCVGLVVAAFLGYCFQLLPQRLRRAVIPWKNTGGT